LVPLPLSLDPLPPSLPPFLPCVSQGRGEADRIIDGHRLVLLGVVEEGGREGGGEEGREGGGDLFLDGVVCGQVGSRGREEEALLLFLL